MYIIYLLYNTAFGKVWLRLLPLIKSASLTFIRKIKHSSTQFHLIYCNWLYLFKFLLLHWQRGFQLYHALNVLFIYVLNYFMSFQTPSHTGCIKNSKVYSYYNMGGSIKTALSPCSVIRFDCLCLPEPKINASDQIILSADSSSKPVTIQCNLTTAHTPHKESFWMKNGQEIPNTRTEHRLTIYR